MADAGGATSRKGSKASRSAAGDRDSLIAPEEVPPDSADELGLPVIQSFKSNDRLFRPRRSLSAVAATGAALLIASGCALAAFFSLGSAPSAQQPADAAIQLWGMCDYRTRSACPALSLLEMQEVQELASRNILRVGHRILGPRHAPAVKLIVRACFNNVSSQLGHRAQQVVRELEMVRFTRPQKDAMLNSLRLLGDPSIQGIGLDIAEAISGMSPKTGASGLSATEASEELKELLKRFELGALGEELELARLLWSEGRQWDLTLEPEHFGSMVRVSSRWHEVIEEASQYDTEPDWTITPVPVNEQTQLAITAAALVQVRVLLDIMKVRTRSVLPASVTSVSSYLGIDRQDVACDLHGERAALNRLACPLKFGVQGMDALRAHFSQQPLVQEPIRGPTSPSTPDPTMMMVPGA